MARILSAGIFGNADATRLCNPFEAHCNIDRLTIDILLFYDDITDVNAYSKFDPFVLRHVNVLFGHTALNFAGTSHGVDHTSELDKRAVTCVLDDPSAILGDFGIKEDLSQSPQLLHCPFFVVSYQPARARNIRRQNCR